MANDPLVRSSFEALLALEYVLENDNDYVQRSLAWVVGFAHDRLAMYERFDPSTTRGATAQNRFSNDMIASTIQSSPLGDVQKNIARLQSFFAKPHIQPIEQVFQARQQAKRPTNWYSLFNGPNNLLELAVHLERGGHYEILYRHWSRTAHAQDLLPFMARIPDGKPAIGRLREPDEVREIASFASGFILQATVHMLRKFRPGEDFDRWYRRDVREQYLKITKDSSLFNIQGLS